MPRSLVFSYQWINLALAGLQSLYQKRYPCHEMAFDTYQRLKNGSMDEIFQAGLHEFLQDFMASKTPPPAAAAAAAAASSPWQGFNLAPAPAATASHDQYGYLSGNQTDGL